MTDTPSRWFNPRLWLIAIVIAAAVVRLVHIQWDENHFFHPDERAVAYAVQRLSFKPLQLDPDFFAYGSLPIYLTKIVSSTLSAVDPRATSYDNVIVNGRCVSAVIGALTVLLLIILGTRLYDRSVGLLAGFLLAACVLHIQNSRFMTVDVTLTFVVLLALYALILVSTRGRVLDFIFAGVAIGLATASKFSAMPLLLSLGIATLYRFWVERRILSVAGRLLAAIVAAGVAFVIAEPYAVLRFDRFKHDILEQSEMVRNAGRLPYTNQYMHVPKYLYDLQQLIVWGMAPLLGIVAVWASVTRVAVAWRSRRVEEWILLSWVVPFFLITGWFEVKFPRYLLPIYPLMILWAAEWLVRKYRGGTFLGRLAAPVVVAGTVASAVAFVSIYTRPFTIVTASQWVYEHIPAGSRILSQHWDEGFPFTFPNHSVSQYKLIEVPYYEPDNEAKIQRLSQDLASGDYIAFQTKRLYGALTRAPEKYPLSNKYFRALFAGDLGYTLIKEVASRPTLFGIEFPDELADESLTVYDHPKVLIFRNTEHLDAAVIAEKILRDPRVPSKTLTRDDLLLAKPGGETTLEATGTAAPIQSSAIALVLFAVLVQILSLATYPVLRIWLKGVGTLALSKTLGVLLFGYVSWLIISLGLASFTQGALDAIVLAFAAIGAVCWRRRDRVPLTRAEIIATEGLFWGPFIFFLCVRMYNPEVYWGEKPMDFSFLNALTRTTTLPPPEPWFAGSPLYYSYFGAYVVAALGKALHLAPALTFNLGIALVGALTAAAAFAVGAAVTNQWQTGLLTAFSVTLIGNLASVRELNSRRLINFDYFWATSRVIPNTINEFPLWSFLFADLHAHVLVLPISLTFLSLAVWLVRPQVMGAPERRSRGTLLVLLLLLSLCLGSIGVTNTWSTPTYILFFVFLLGVAWLTENYRAGSFRFLLKFLTCFAILGVAAFIGAWFQLWTWNVQTYVLLFLIPLIVVGAASLIENDRAAWFSFLFGLLTRFCGPAVTIVVGAYVLFSPYWRDFHPPPRNWNWERGPYAMPRDFLQIFGLFLFILVPLLFALWGRMIGRNGARQRWQQALLVVAAIALPLGSLGVSTRAFATILFLLGAQLVLMPSTESRWRIPLAMATFAFAVTAGCELVFVWDRMNTIFKFYLDSWLLLAVASAVVVRELWAGAVPLAGLRRVWQVALAGLVGVTLFTAATDTYGVISTNRVQTPKPTLDGMAYLQRKAPEELAAYEWLNRHIQGIPVILEAHGDSYQEFTRVSMNTGLPTVLGWTYHVTQRGQKESDISRRRVDITTAYTSDNKDMVAAILQRYGVALVFVGGLERRTYAGANLERFTEWTDLLTPVYQNPGVTIFAVNGRFTGTMPITTIAEVPHAAAAQEEAAPAAQDAPGKLQQPRGIAVTKEGNILVSDFGNNRIQEFGPDLSLIRFWGTRGELPGQFKEPCDVAVGPTGEIFVADTWTPRVEVFSKDGKYLREWSSLFYGPRGIAVDDKGSVFVADTGNHRILRFSNTGIKEREWGGKGSEPGHFSEPVGLVTDAAGKLYVCDNGNGRVQIFTRDGAFVGAFPVPGWESKVYSEPYITLDPRGTIWVTVPTAKEIRNYDTSGKLLHTIMATTLPGATPETIPMGIDYSPTSRELIIADLERRILRIPLPGTKGS